MDIQKSSSWLLFHHSLFHTFVHHDADGYSTWTQILEGMKIWVLIRPKGYMSFRSRKDFWEACVEYLEDTPDENGYYGRNSERYIVYGQPGDIM